MMKLAKNVGIIVINNAYRDQGVAKDQLEIQTLSSRPSAYQSN